MKRVLSFWKLFAAIAIVVLGAVIVRGRQSGPPKAATHTVIAKRGTVLESVSGNGVLQPVTTVEVKSNVGGQVVELTVDEGDRVTAGQLIAKIDPSDSASALDQARADYSSAAAKVDQAKQALTMQRLQTAATITSAEEALAASRERLSQAQQEADVQPKLTAAAIRQAQSSLESADASLSQTKAALVPQKLSSARAAYDQAQASFVQADRALARQRALYAKGFVAKSQVDDAEAQYGVATAQLDIAKSKLDTVKDEARQDLRAAEAKASQAQSALETARVNSVQDELKRRDLAASSASLKQALAALATARASAHQDEMKSEDILQARAQLQRAKAAVDNAQTQLGYTTVVAPRAGVVVKKYAERGSIITAGRQAMAGSGSGVTIVEIADISRMQVKVDVDETDIAKIALGQDVEVKVDACPDERFPAKVIKIAPKASVSQNVTTVPVTVELTHTDARLKPEMNATCEFVIARKQNVVCAPVEAVTETDSGHHVTVLDHGMPVERKVEVGLTGNDVVEITRGLQDGETLVITDEEPVKSNQRGPGGPGGPPPM